MAEAPFPQTDSDLAFQRRFWTLERCAWACFALFVLSAFLGLFGGHGLLHDAHVAAHGLDVQYGRFERMQSPATLRFALDDTTTPRVWIDDGYLDAISILGISPRPASTRSEHGGVTFAFDAHGEGPVNVVIDAKIDRPGVLRGRVESGDARVALTQFIYP